MTHSARDMIEQDVLDVYRCLNMALEYAKDREWANVSWWIDEAELCLEHLNTISEPQERTAE